MPCSKHMHRQKSHTHCVCPDALVSAVFDCLGIVEHGMDADVLKALRIFFATLVECVFLMWRPTR